MNYIRWKLFLLYSYSKGKIWIYKLKAKLICLSLLYGGLLHKASFPKFSLKRYISIFPHKTAYFSDNSHDALKNADDLKFHITKLYPWKLIFRKQPIIAGDEIRVNVILTTKYKVKTKHFIIPIFHFPVSFLLLLLLINPRIRT